MIASRRCRLAWACLPLILAACGGDGTPATASAADTTSPWVVLTTVGNSNGILHLEATANDDVQVTAVRFRIDGFIANADVLAAGQTRISGAMRGVPGEPDVDVYKFSLDGDRMLSVEMLTETLQGFQVRLVDANGTALGTPQYMSASDVDTVTYANGATRRDVYIEVTSLDADFGGHEQYRLTLFVH
jgi:hypothetical protein